MRRAPALILGGGPAGSAAAIAIRRGGGDALVLERSRETGDALCGGFLSWRTLDRLAALGVEADRLNPRRITRVHLFAGGAQAEAPLPFPALAVSRRRLDTRLLDAAERAGAWVERGGAIRTLDGLTAHLADGAVLSADAVFLATGKHDLRGAQRPTPGPDDDPAMGVRIRLALPDVMRRRVEDAIELHLFDRGYAGLAVQEDGSANLCLAVKRSRLREAGGPDALLDAIAAEATAFADRLAFRSGPSDAVANVPYGWRATTGVAGLFRLGDQAAVIPSLAGEGMGIAVASGCSAARAYLTGGANAAPGWQRRFARRAARPVTAAGLVRDLAEGPLATPALPWFARAPGLIQFVARATRIA